MITHYIPAGCDWIALNAQNRVCGILRVLDDGMFVQQPARPYQPPRALRGHVYDGQPRPIGEYFPKVRRSK